MTRQHWVLLHRWAGLVMAAFLIIVVVTGSLLAFGVLSGAGTHAQSAALSQANIAR
ncbi:MAG: hypothetical protein FCKEOINB_01557 [Nitrosomonas sp.]|nr:hypothetical protein [Nitrosomonas sp.]